MDDLAETLRSGSTMIRTLAEELAAPGCPLWDARLFAALIEISTIGQLMADAISTGLWTDMRPGRVEAVRLWLSEASLALDLLSDRSRGQI